MSRVSITDFAFAKPLYRNASVSFYTVAAGVKTATLATLYSGQTGAATLANPQKLDSRGKFKQAVYVEVSVIGTIQGVSIPSHDTGIINGFAIRFRINTTTGFLEYSLDGGVTWTSTGNPDGQFVTMTYLTENAIRFVDTIAALKALAVPASAVTYFVRGYYALGDGGGGFYYWKSTDTTADNGGTVIALTVGGTGRFNLL